MSSLLSTSSSPSFNQQWQNFLHNLGDWSGSFTQLSPQGAIQQNIPSLVSIKGLNNNQEAELTLQHFSPETQAEIKRLTLSFSSNNLTTPFFDTGAFSQGSTQFSPNGQFGAELGLIWGDRRLRLVQLFQEGRLDRLTLIRECRAGCHRRDAEDAEVKPGGGDERGQEGQVLQVAELVGEWCGEAVTLDASWREAGRVETRLVVERSGDRLQQTLTMPGFELTSVADIQGNVLRFDQGKFPVQVLLLPGGASSNTPLTLPRGLPFFLEVGWLIEPGLRQRLIRSYGDRGEFVSLTLVTERDLKKLVAS